MRLEVIESNVNRKKYDEYGENWQHADNLKVKRQQRQYQVVNKEVLAVSVVVMVAITRFF
jgi:hypothetical protein